MPRFNLYIKTGDKFVFYGNGDMNYIMELLNNYLIINNMYKRNSSEFKIEAFTPKQMP